MIRQHHRQTRAAEIGPVPIGRRHLLQRLFQQPGPNAVRPACGVRVLQANHPEEDLLGPRPIAARVALQQSQRVIQGGQHGVNPSAGGHRRVVARTVELLPQHLLLFTVAIRTLVQFHALLAGCLAQSHP